MTRPRLSASGFVKNTPRQADDRRQRVEDRGQKTDDRRQRADDRGQIKEVQTF